MENTNAKKRKRLSPILLIFIILAALTAALVCAALIIWMSGRASLSGKEAKAPMLVEVPASAEPDENGGIAAPHTRAYAERADRLRYHQRRAVL